MKRSRLRFVSLLLIVLEDHFRWRKRISESGRGLVDWYIVYSLCKIMNKRSIPTTIIILLRYYLTSFTLPIIYLFNNNYFLSYCFKLVVIFNLKSKYIISRLFKSEIIHIYHAHKSIIINYIFLSIRCG